MNDEIIKRIIKIRNDFKLNQANFASKINLSRNAITFIETGRRNPSDRTISDICREFNVNEHWLRTGEGEPYIQLETNKTIAISASLLGQHDPLFESIVEVYSKLNDFNKEVLLTIMEDIVNTYHSKKE